MKILFIVPIPPPINGQSLASKVLIDSFNKEDELLIINTSKSMNKDFRSILYRVFFIPRFFLQVLYFSFKCDLVYFHISESLFGNIKDLFVYLILFNKLNKTFVHLHGGTFIFSILLRNYLLKNINLFFIKRINKFIVLGDSHFNNLKEFIPSDKIRIVPNFCQDFLFSDRYSISKKYSSYKKMNIVFMSNLIPGKGYLSLLESLFCLSSDIFANINLHFCGDFNSLKEKEQFLCRISQFNNITYHGVVSAEIKKNIFSNSHIFILPTDYYEGQPISILEAYASGCVVLVTNKGGIIDIFKNNLNGFWLKSSNPEDIAEMISYCYLNFFSLRSIAYFNWEFCKDNFTQDDYIYKIKKILKTP